MRPRVPGLRRRSLAVSPDRYAPQDWQTPHIAEQAAKIPIFGRLHCCDCSLPDVAYPCLESQSVKIQRERHCCGTRDGI